MACYEAGLELISTYGGLGPRQGGAYPGCLRVGCLGFNLLGVYGLDEIMG